MKTTLNKKTIKDTKEVIALIAVLTKIAFEAKRDDDVIDIKDIPRLIETLPVITPAFDGISNVLEELTDLDKDELDDLLAYVRSKFTSIIPEEAFDTLNDVLEIAAAGKRIYDRHVKSADPVVK